MGKSCELVPFYMLLAKKFASTLCCLLIVVQHAQQLPVETVQSTKFYVVPVPQAYDWVRGEDMSCREFGHMYSFEYYFSQNLIENAESFLVDDPYQADFIVLPHCITYVYHVLRYGMDFNTVAKAWEALDIAQREYLLPRIEFAKGLPWYKDLEARMVIPYAMDKGRVDYPLASEATATWHAVTTVGSNTWLSNSPQLTFLQTGRTELAFGFVDNSEDPSDDELSEAARAKADPAYSDPNRSYWVDPVFTLDGEPRIYRFLHAVEQEVEVWARLAPEHPYFPPALPHDPCAKQTSISKRPFLWYPQDVVVPVPTSFYFNDEAKLVDRKHLLFYAGSSNSCTRKMVVEVAASLWQNMTGVVILRKAVEKHVWRQYMYDSKYCLVPDGFSSISARFYEVLMHGCVPVVISEAFHGAFEHSLDWGQLALFVRRRDVTAIPNLLREVSDERYQSMHRTITRIHASLHVESFSFWFLLFRELRVRQRES